MARHAVGSTRSRGFTFVEVLVVFAIIVVLAFLLAPNFTTLLNRAQAPICSARLVNLWTVFSSNLQDGSPWPQVPTNIPIGSSQEQQWWLAYGSNKMGLSSKDWNCPTIARMLSSSSNSALVAHPISYLPMLFDANPGTPMQCLNMPWFTEIANVHGHGAQMIRGDGAVITAPVLAVPHH